MAQRIKKQLFKDLYCKKKELKDILKLR